MKTMPLTRVGWVYLPSSAFGFAIVVVAAAFCATVFAAVDRHSHSVSDSFYGVYPFFVSTFLLVDWVGRRSSTPRRAVEADLGPSGVLACRPGADRVRS